MSTTFVYQSQMVPSDIFILSKIGILKTDRVDLADQNLYFEFQERLHSVAYNMEQLQTETAQFDYFLIYKIQNDEQQKNLVKFLKAKPKLKVLIVAHIMYDYRETLVQLFDQLPAQRLHVIYDDKKNPYLINRKILTRALGPEKILERNLIDASQTYQAQTENLALPGVFEQGVRFLRLLLLQILKLLVAPFETTQSFFARYNFAFVSGKIKVATIWLFYKVRHLSVMSMIKAVYGSKVFLIRTFYAIVHFFKVHLMRFLHAARHVTWMSFVRSFYGIKVALIRGFYAAAAFIKIGLVKSFFFLRHSIVMLGLNFYHGVIVGSKIAAIRLGFAIQHFLKVSLLKLINAIRHFSVMSFIKVIYGIKVLVIRGFYAFLHFFKVQFAQFVHTVRHMTWMSFVHIFYGLKVAFIRGFYALIHFFKVQVVQICFTVRHLFVMVAIRSFFTVRHLIITLAIRGFFTVRHLIVMVAIRSFYGLRSVFTQSLFLIRVSVIRSYYALVYAFKVPGQRALFSIRHYIVMVHIRSYYRLRAVFLNSIGALYSYCLRLFYFLKVNSIRAGYGLIHHLKMFALKSFYVSRHYIVMTCIVVFYALKVGLIRSFFAVRHVILMSAIRTYYPLKSLIQQAYFRLLGVSIWSLYRLHEFNMRFTFYPIRKAYWFTEFQIQKRLLRRHA